MTDSPSYPDPNDDRGRKTGVARGRAPATPRWVKLLGILGLIVILLVVVVMLVGGTSHGPGRHGTGGDAPGVQFTALPWRAA